MCKYNVVQKKSHKQNIDIAKQSGFMYELWFNLYFQDETLKLDNITAFA